MATQFDAERLRAIADAPAITDIQWHSPQPIVTGLEMTTYPIDALPPGLLAAVEEVQSFVQSPLALVAASALSAVATVGQGLVDVRRANRLTGPTSLYMLTEAQSGERKTATDQFFMRPIRAWEQEQRQAADAELRAYKADLAAWNAQLAGLGDAIRAAAKQGRDTSHQEEQLRALQAREPVAPVVPRLVFSDVTSEALAARLATGWPVGSICSDEGGAVLGGHSLKDDNLTAGLALLNALWSGADFWVDRKSAPSFAVANVRAGASLMVQREVLVAFHERAGSLASGSGLYARFLITTPESTIGTRAFREAPAAWPALSAFERRMCDLLALELPRDSAGHLRPTVLDLDAEAKSLWVGFHDDVEQALAPGGTLADTQETAAKIAEQAARVAAQFHTYERGPAGLISAATMAAAVRVVGWHLLCARKMFAEIALPTEIGDALKLDAWLRAEAQASFGIALPRRLAQQRGPVRAGPRLDAALRELAQLDRVQVRKIGKRILIAVNPQLLEEAP